MTAGAPRAVATEVPPPAEVWCSRSRRAAMAMLLALLCQFALGITTNLYTAIPARHPGSHPGDYFAGSVHSIGWAIGHGGIALALHALLGIALAGAALVAVAPAVRSRDRGTIAAMSAAAGCVVGAGFNGASFLDFADDASSLIMALLFALAMLFYLVIVYRLHPQRPTAAGLSR